MNLIPERTLRRYGLKFILPEDVLAYRLAGKSVNLGRIHFPDSYFNIKIGPLTDPYDVVRDSLQDIAVRYKLLSFIEQQETHNGLCDVYHVNVSYVVVFCIGNMIPHVSEMTEGSRYFDPLGITEFV